MLCDFHSHVLYGVDDGANDIKTSIAMLKKSKEHGVDTVVLTSHCYPRSLRDIDKFLMKREGVYTKLSQISDLPQLYKGCEVHLTGDISRLSSIKKLCIENTNYMLLEMPHTSWTDKTIEYVYKLNLIGITPIIAHDERNMHQRSELRNTLYDLNVLIQINAPSLMKFTYRKQIDKMMRIGVAHVIGSDMHNMIKRKPCMDKAEKIIKKRYGAECWDYMMNNAERILNGETISFRDFKAFKKRTIF